MSIDSAMPSNHLILCRHLLLLPPIPPSIRVFSNESTLRRAQAIFALSPLAIEKQDVRWFLKPARLGIATGHVDDEGNVSVPGQVGQTYDIILWLKGFEPVVVKNVTCPANLGTQQSSGKNETLREIFEDHRR